MLDRIRQNTIKGLFSNSGEPTSIDGGDIRIIGDTRSGKTTYLASLAYWRNANPTSPVQSIVPYGDQGAGAELISKAQNILEQGLELEKTDLNADVSEVKDYGLSIVLKEKFSVKNGNLRPRMVKLNINCKDYSGEFFADLIHKKGDPKLDNYIEDCQEVRGILFLVDGTTRRKDAQYARGLERFFQELDHIDSLKNEKPQRRIAFAITKCEQSQLWVSRHDPEALASRRFSEVKKKLTDWQTMNSGQVDYFMTSAFGTIGHNYPEPNSTKIKCDRDGTLSVIRKPKLWRPFGLVAPLYWLCTGQRHPELDKD